MNTKERALALLFALLMLTELIGCASEGSRPARVSPEKNTSTAESPPPAGPKGSPSTSPAPTWDYEDYAELETLRGWTFQFNEKANDYSLFFGLLNHDKEPISAAVDVDIRIVNENGEEVYHATKAVSKDDFGDYTSQARGEEYLANIRIPASDITPGTAVSGTVFLTIHKNDFVLFDEVNCEALYCLPVLDAQVICSPLPVELAVKDYSGKVQSILLVNTVTYRFEKSYSPQLEITVSGEKTLEANSSVYSSPYDKIAYKLYDSDGYVVDSGSLYLQDLSMGDKFRDSITFYDAIPGMTYTLKLVEAD